MPETKIPSLTPNLSLLAEQLAIQLNYVVEAAEQNDWDKTADLVHKLIPALEAFGSLPLTTDGSAVNVPLLQETKARLDKAIVLCSTRLEQISPLVNALKIKHLPTDKP